jgi:hypothetical protein
MKSMAFEVDRSPTIITALACSGMVSRLDIAWLRREVFGDGRVSRQQAEELFAVARCKAAKAPEWTAFFVEMITDHLLDGTRGSGVVSRDDADWLIGEVDRTMTAEAVAALANVLAEARRAPKWLIAAARARAAGGWPGVREALAGSAVV